MLVFTGTGIDTDLCVRGNPLKIKFDAGCETVKAEVLNNGWEHHWTLMYGDHTESLRDLARNLEIEFTQIK